jgi:hypothetical protein
MRRAPHGSCLRHLPRKFESTSIRIFDFELFRIKTSSSARNGPSEQRTARLFLVLFLACFLAAALASQRFFDSLSLARLQVKGVTFYFLDNVLSLHLPLEPPQRVFEGFTLLKSNFRQKTTPPTRPNWTR